MANTMTIHELGALDSAVKTEIRALEAPWYVAHPELDERWRYPGYGAESLLTRMPNRAETVYVVLTRDTGGALIAWCVFVLRGGTHTIRHTYVAVAQQGQGISDAMIGEIKVFVGGPVMFRSHTVSGDDTADRNGLVLVKVGKR